MDEHVSAAGSVTRKLTVKETAAYLAVSKSWLDKRRLDGNGPAYLKLGRRVVYDIIDLENWAASNRRRHTSESTGLQRGI
jgi:predicted DNA-binding transcriptional regulator AlpA